MEEQQQEDNNKNVDEKMTNIEGQSNVPTEEEILQVEYEENEESLSESRHVNHEHVPINTSDASVDLDDVSSLAEVNLKDGTNIDSNQNDNDDVGMTKAMPVDHPTTSFQIMTPVAPSDGRDDNNVVSGDIDTTTTTTAAATPAAFIATVIKHLSEIENEEHPEDGVDEADGRTEKPKSLVESTEKANLQEEEQIEQDVDCTNPTDSTAPPPAEIENPRALVTVTSTLSDETSSTRSSSAPSTTNLLNLKEKEGTDQKYHPVDLETAASAVVVTKKRGGTADVLTSSSIDEVDIQEQLIVTRKRNLLGFVAVLLLIILLIGVPITIYMTTFHSSSSDSSTSTTSDGSNHLASSDFANNLREMVPGVANYTIETIRNDFNSPQAKAYEWIASDPEWHDKYQTTWRKQQRFAMACVFYSFSKRFPLYHDRHECNWRYRRQTVMCNTRGQVLGLSWLHMMWTELVLHRDTFLPPEMELLPQLETLDFSGSLFRVKYEEQGEYTHTELETFLPLYNVPNSLRALKVLKLSGCTGLQGSLPTSLGSLTSLTLLDLSRNELTGEIPSQLGQLRRLHTLDLSVNALTGTIPSELGQLDDLSTMRLQSNELSGTIPFQLGELPLLNVVLVEENELQYYVPPGFCSIGPMAELSTDWCWTLDNCCD